MDHMTQRRTEVGVDGAQQVLGGLGRLSVCLIKVLLPRLSELIHGRIRISKKGFVCETEANQLDVAYRSISLS